MPPGLRYCTNSALLFFALFRRTSRKHILFREDMGHMLRNLLMNRLMSLYAKLKEIMLTYGKWVEENEYYLACY